MTKLTTNYRLVDAADHRGADRTDRILATLFARIESKRDARRLIADDLSAPGLFPAETLGLLERFNRALAEEREASNSFHVALAAAEGKR